MTPPLRVKFVRWLPIWPSSDDGVSSGREIDRNQALSVSELSSKDTICNINDIIGQVTTMGRYEFVSATILACPKKCGAPNNDNRGFTNLEQFFKTRLIRIGMMCESCRVMSDIGSRGCSREMIRISTAGTQANPVVHLYGKGNNLDSYISVDGERVFSSIKPCEGGWKGPLMWGLGGRLRIEVGFTSSFSLLSSLLLKY